MRSPLARRLRALNMQPPAAAFRGMFEYSIGGDFWAEVTDPRPGIYALLEHFDREGARWGRINADGTRQVSEPLGELSDA